jgi:FkbM family methyltransferase
MITRYARKLVGATIRYLQRLGRWPIILVQVRGANWLDELKLLASAAAAPGNSLRGLSTWQDPILLFDAIVRVGDIGTFHARRRSDDLWHVLPWRERGIHRALRRMLRPGDVFIDAGANIGIYTLLASRLVGPAGRVLAIEMMPDTAAILRRHISENGCDNVEVIEKALSDCAGEIAVARVAPGKFGQASITKSKHGEEVFDEREVQTTTLDNLCHGLDQIRLIKLDLEGAELQALGGSRLVMGRTESVIYESHTSRDELAQTFEHAGFRVSRRLGKDQLAERQPEHSE